MQQIQHRIGCFGIVQFTKHLHKQCFHLDILFDLQLIQQRCKCIGGNNIVQRFKHLQPDVYFRIADHGQQFLLNRFVDVEQLLNKKDADVPDIRRSIIQITEQCLGGLLGIVGLQKIVVIDQLRGER